MKYKKMRPFLLVAGIVLVLSIPFVWLDWPSLSKQIDPNKISAWGTVLSAVFTSITVYLLYRQNIQQYEASKAATHPDLYPAEIDLKTKDSKTTSSDFKTIGTEYTIPVFKKRLAKEDALFDSSISVSLHNIGLAASKEIKVKWKYNPATVDKYIADYYPDLMGLDLSTIEEVIDFIPANSSVDIELPMKYVSALGSSNYHPLQPKRVIPSLFLEITFLDIYNNETTKYFKTRVRCLADFVGIKFKQVKKDEVVILF